MPRDRATIERSNEIKTYEAGFRFAVKGAPTAKEAAAAFIAAGVVVLPDTDTDADSVAAYARQYLSPGAALDTWEVYGTAGVGARSHSEARRALAARAKQLRAAGLEVGYLVGAVQTTGQGPKPRQGQVRFGLQVNRRGRGN